MTRDRRKNGLIWLLILLIVTALLGIIYVAGNGEAEISVDKNNQTGQISNDQIGSKDAPVMITEYADLMCSSCVEFHEKTLPQVQQNYIDTGKATIRLKLVNKIAPDSLQAAEGAQCAAEEDKYIEYIDAAFAELSEERARGISAYETTIYSSGRIGDLADTIEIDRQKFEACVSSGKYKSKVASVTTEFDELEKVYGTPHFIIDGKGYNGAAPYAIFKAAIDAAL